MRPRTDQPGIALLVVMLLTMVVAAIAAGAALIGANSFLINQYDARSNLLETVADAGLELGRARLNANPGLYNDTAVSLLEYDAAVVDAQDDAIPHVRRTVYAMPLGGGLGEYGNYSALISVAADGSGARVIRRLDLLQESFAIYAYFTDVEPAEIAFGNNDQLYGPVHSNSDIKVRETGATFHGPVTTASGFVGAQYASFLDDTVSQVTPILMPSTGQLEALRSRATPAALAFTAEPGGNAGQSTLRLHFVSRDVDDDGVEEGFVRVYRSSNPSWVTANIPPLGNLSTTPNCLLGATPPRCYLGGDEALSGGAFEPANARGAWVPFPDEVDPQVGASTDGDYLFPIDRRINPAFRGVIYVDGKVVLSGTVRGRLTVAATGNIIIGDDLVYNTNPGAGTCEDVLGLFSGGNVIVADNTINAPRQPPSTSTFYTYDDTPSENIHATVLALGQFTVQNPATGATSAEWCSGMPWGRGCLNVTGGIIQRSRGTVAYSNGTGNVKRYTHDTCAFTAPPPYFPSTGHFWRGRYYQVDPTGFDIDTYFQALN